MFCYRGIVDKEMGRYIDYAANKTLTIKEAIDQGLIIAGEGEASAPLIAATSTQDVRSYTIKSVIDPRTGEEITIGDAVRHKIVDKDKGEYLNLETDEVQLLHYFIFS